MELSGLRPTVAVPPGGEQLAMLFTRVTLSIYLVDRMREAIEDMPLITPAQLFERFLAWTANVRE